jgi:Tol biopolymer transport system component
LVLAGLLATTAASGGTAPNRALIAFTRCRLPDSCSAGADIWVMRPDVSGLAWITRDGTHNESPAWSPDGKRIVFVSGRGTSDELWSMNPDGSGKRRLTGLGGLDEQPAWSPDGRHIAFVRKLSSKSSSIELIDTEGGKRRVLTDDHGDHQHPSWSPDGRQIVFSYSADPDIDRYALYVVDADGTKQHRLSGGSSVGDYLDPAWSPDGRRIAFSYLTPVDRTYSADLEVMNAGGGGRRVVLHAPPGTVYFGPSWSSGGKRIVFVSLTNKTGLGQIGFVSSSATTARPPGSRCLVDSSKTGSDRGLPGARCAAPIV